MNVLAFEWDHDQAAAIRHVVCDVLREELTVVHSVEDALRALGASQPDLVLLPALMPPADETALLTSLRTMPDGNYIETLVTPLLGRRGGSRVRPAPSWWRSWGARQASEQPGGADDARLFAQRLAWSLRRAQEKRDNPGDDETMARQLDSAAVCPADHPPVDMDAPRFPAIESWVIDYFEAATPEERAMLSEGGDLVVTPSGDRRVHPRFQAHELTGLRSARIMFGPQVSVIDLSVGGALFETNIRVQPNSEAVLEVFDGKRHTQVPFRVVRCHVAALDGPRFREACVFTKALDLAELMSVAADAVTVDPPNLARDSFDVVPENKIETRLAKEDGRTERRRHLRVDGPFRGFRHDDLATQVMIRNLSEGGCFVDSLVEERAGRRFSLDISTLRDDRITVTGRVVHNSPGFGFALCFVDVPAAARASLARLVAARTA